MSEILSKEEVETLRDVHRTFRCLPPGSVVAPSEARMYHAKVDGMIGPICDSHEALRELLGDVVHHLDADAIADLLAETPEPEGFPEIQNLPSALEFGKRMLRGWLKVARAKLKEAGDE